MTLSKEIAELEKKKATLQFARELAEITKLLELSQTDFPRAEQEWTRFKAERGLEG